MVDRQPDSTHAIELRLRRVAQLFDSLDPAPFRAKALDPAAHKYILESALELPADAALRLVIHLPREAEAEAAGLETAIQHHFTYQSEHAQRLLRRQMRTGRIGLLAGLVLLAACSLIRSTLGDAMGGPSGFIGEGLLILGWVALWRPVEVLLFERWESRDERRFLRQLATAPVEIVLHAEVPT